jgi:hypothetical protein
VKEQHKKEFSVKEHMRKMQDKERQNKSIDIFSYDPLPSFKKDFSKKDNFEVPFRSILFPKLMTSKIDKINNNMNLNFCISKLSSQKE